MTGQNDAIRRSTAANEHRHGVYPRLTSRIRFTQARQQIRDAKPLAVAALSSSDSSMGCVCEMGVKLKLIRKLKGRAAVATLRLF